MQPVSGNMTQDQFDKLNAELADLEMRQMFKYSKDRAKRIKELKKKMGIDNETADS